MTLLANLIKAEQAVKYANDKLLGRSSNRSEDNMHAVQKNLMTSIEGRQMRLNGQVDRKDSIEELQERLGDIKYTERLVTVMHTNKWDVVKTSRARREEIGRSLDAAEIIRDKIGNCQEHAILACHYLNNKGVSSYMVTTEDDINHVFVIIGGPDNLDGKIVSVTRDDPAAIFGNFTVVCDPWYHEWFSVQQEWRQKMWGILNKTKKEWVVELPSSLQLTLTSSNHIT